MSHGENTKNMQLEIDHLRRKLHWKQRRWTSSSSELSSDDDNDDSYMPKSRTPSVSLIHVMRTAIIGGEAKVHLTGTGVMMLWAGPCAKFLSHRLHVGLNEENFLGDLLNQRLPCIMVEQTLWSTLVTSTKEWPFTQRIKPMCKVFPSSLGPVVMRWFDGLRESSINSFKELIRVFGARFVTCSRVPRPLDSLLSMTMREGETLKMYSNRYWEMFNK